MKWMGIAAIAFILGASPGLEAAKRIVVLHQGRPKPLDSFAREAMRTLTGKERFTGYRDPETHEKVTVFGDADPVEAFLKLIAEPQKYRAFNFIRVDHPELKHRFKLDERRLYFSLKDFDACREELKREEARIDPDEATSAERALLTLINQQNYVDAIFEERVLTIVPIPFGESGYWMTPGDLQVYLSGARPTDPRSRFLQEELESFVGKNPSAVPLLRTIVDEVARLKVAVAANDSAGMGSAATALDAALRALNPQEMPTVADVDRELWYNRLDPFAWSRNLFLFAVIAFALAYAFGSKKLWLASLGLQSAAIGMTAYGYGLRWMIADRYPLSNHYESMIMVAFAAAIISLIAELLNRRNIFGLAGAIAAFVMLALAQSVGIFAEQSAIKSIAPALMTFWMTIHVPVIMSGYAGGLIICVLGHIYLFMHLFRRPTPEKAAELERLDETMYRALQVTVLFLLAGILLGAVWVGEAWGRPWGWDMKETWALITLVAYIAALHGRFTGYVKGLGTALCAIFSFMLVILCYYGVNFIFGKGLHTYGFGSGEIWPVVAFFAFEALLMGAAGAVEIARRLKARDEGTPA